MLLFLALLRDPRAEGATRIRPADLGRLLGLDRAPEVKTLRRKLTELAGCRRGAALQAALARAHADARPDALGFLHVDGHVRVYAGTRDLPKTHIARMHLAVHATAERHPQPPGAAPGPPGRPAARRGTQAARPRHRRWPPTTPSPPSPGCCARTTAGPTTKPAPCSGRPSPSPATCTSPGTPCTSCLLYTSDAADEEDSVDLGGRRIIKKKN